MAISWSRRKVQVFIIRNGYSRGWKSSMNGVPHSYKAYILEHKFRPFIRLTCISKERSLFCYLPQRHSNLIECSLLIAVRKYMLCVWAFTFNVLANPFLFFFFSEQWSLLLRFSTRPRGPNRIEHECKNYIPSKKSSLIR